VGHIGLDYFKSGQVWLWPHLETQIRPDLESEPDLEELVFGSQNNMPDETNAITNAISCYKEELQFRLALLHHCLPF